MKFFKWLKFFDPNTEIKELVDAAAKRNIDFILSLDS
jgi:hypothetical protein